MGLLSTGTNPVTQRNTGIDLLRIIAAYYVIILHILLCGGLAHAVREGTFQHFLCTGLQSWTMCAVNLFGLVSGYVGYSEKEPSLKFKKYLLLWLQVVFYNVLLTLLTLWLRPAILEQYDLIRMFFPVLCGGYWYFTAYSALFLFIPLLNAAVSHCSNNLLLQLLACIVFVFSPIETLFGAFSTNLGYSFAWLLILYLVGAILKKTALGSRLHPLIVFVGILSLTFLGFLTAKNRWCIEIIGLSFDSGMVNYYVSPLQLVIAIQYVILFSRLKPSPFFSKLIAFAAPGAFAVYIINDQKHVWNGYMKDHFVSWAGSSPIGIAARVLLTAAVFVTVSLVVDYFRRLLFRIFRKRKA